MALGTYPSRRYARAWMTQRIVNRAPGWSYIRKVPNSVGQQIINPLGNYIQETVQQLTKERYNMFVSTADVSELDQLHFLDLPSSMEFDSTENSAGESNYTPPQVYGTISGSEYEITQAEKNNIETMSYDSIASRIEENGTAHVYSEVIPTGTFANLGTVSPGTIVV